MNFYKSKLSLINHLNLILNNSFTVSLDKLKLLSLFNSSSMHIRKCVENSNYILVTVLRVEINAISNNSVYVVLIVMIAADDDLRYNLLTSMFCYFKDNFNMNSVFFLTVCVLLL